MTLPVFTIGPVPLTHERKPLEVLPVSYRGWVVGGQRGDDHPRPRRRAQVRTHPGRLPIAGFDELKAHCGGSWHVFGGGAQPSGPTITEQLESTAPFDGDDANGWLDDGWLGGASNLGSVPQTLKTYAICSHDAPDYPTITSDTGGVGGINGAGQGCEPQIVGGGIRPSTTPGNTHLLETKPLAELTDWEGSLYQDAGPADAELEVYAYARAAWTSSKGQRRETPRAARLPRR
jgi:hypothetical protein